MKVFAFAASSSSQSINKTLVRCALKNLESTENHLVDLNDFELPLFSQDREKELGAPELAQSFVDHIKDSDGLVISFAEHNGTYTAAFKNLFDWCTRIEKKLYQDKPMLMMATSPGARGASSVLDQAASSAPFFAGKVISRFSLPSYQDNFDPQSLEITDDELKQSFQAAIEKFQQVLANQ